MITPPPEESQSTRIIELRSENFKRLKAVTIRPDGNMVRIVGKNGAGKSSVLDSIASALGGGDVSPNDPIRHGAKKAKIVLELEDLTVTRTFTKAGSTLIVEGKDGTPRRSPQELLNRLTGKVTFDPLLFLSLPPRQKLDTLRSLVGIDTKAIDSAKQKAFDERTLVNRDLEQQKALVARLPFHKDAPAAEESSTEVLAEIDKANSHNDSVHALRESAEAAQEDLGTCMADLDTANTEVARIEKLLATAKETVTARTAELAKAKKNSDEAKAKAGEATPVDVAPFKAKLAGLEAANAKVRANKQRADAEAAVKAKQTQSDSLTRKISDCDEQKQRLVESAKFPVSGLALGEDGVVFNGVALEQASDAEKLRVSVAIAAAMNPKLKIMLARNASLLDDESLKLLGELADKHGLQIWLEVVSSTDKTGVVIEDGHILGQEVVETEEPAIATTQPPPDQHFTGSSPAEMAPDQPQLDLPPSR